MAGAPNSQDRTRRPVFLERWEYGLHHDRACHNRLEAGGGPQSAKRLDPARGSIWREQWSDTCRAGFLPDQIEREAVSTGNGAGRSTPYRSSAKSRKHRSPRGFTVNRQRFPNVHVELSEALGAERTAMLERGEVHVGIRLDQGDPRFESRVLPPAEALAVGDTSLELGHAGLIDIGRLASYPLPLLDPGYSIPRLFDATCRLANVEPNILLESRAPHTLLALAEAGQGVAIIPTLQRTDRYNLRIVRVTHRRKPIRERVAIQWDRRRPLPPYAVTFCETLAEYMHTVLPITHPTKTKTADGQGNWSFEGFADNERQFGSQIRPIAGLDDPQAPRRVRRRTGSSKP